MIYKKIFAFAALLAVIVMIVLSGCAQESSVPSATAAGTNTPAATATATPSPTIEPTPEPTPNGEDTRGSEPGVDNAVVYNGYIYYINKTYTTNNINSIYKVKPDGTDQQMVAYGEFWNLALIGTRLFTIVDGNLCSADITTLSKADDFALVSDGDYRFITGYEHKIFGIEYVTGAVSPFITCVDMDGSNKINLEQGVFDSFTTTFQLQIRDRYIFYSDSAKNAENNMITRKIYRLSLDGTEKKELFSVENERPMVFALTPIDGEIYTSYSLLNAQGETECFNLIVDYEGTVISETAAERHTSRFVFTADGTQKYLVKVQGFQSILRMEAGGGETFVDYCGSTNDDALVILENSLMYLKYENSKLVLFILPQGAQEPIALPPVEESAQ